MRIALMIGFCCCFLSTTALAAESESNKYQPEKGDQALQFQINSNFRLDSFNGDLISYKWMISDRHAVSIGIGLESFLGDDEDNTTFPSADSLNVQRTSERWNHDLEVSALLITIRPHKGSWFYYGFGPKLGYHANHDESHQSEPVTYSHASEHSMHAFEAGLVGVSGVEWALNSFLSLHAEYKCSLYYLFRVEESMHLEPDPAQNHESKGENHFWLFRSEGVRFGLSVYF